MKRAKYLIRVALLLLGVNCFTMDGAYAQALPEEDHEHALVRQICNKIAAAERDLTEAEMKLYTNTIPGTNVSFVMVPIKGGEFNMGSPDTEPGRRPDEGPLHRVKVSAFWMGRCEVTWDEYEPFMMNVEEKNPRDATYKSGTADAVTKPSKPYVDMSFGMGKHRYPAIGMTHHAANKYCEWLSAKTGYFYRLPTEAEWEYACRAGTSTAFSFGDDSSQLSQYAWFDDNSDGKYQRVGTKKPNPWGLYDMHGNVAEWCLDQYEPDAYLPGKNIVSENPWNKGTKPYPHVIRGGAWDGNLGAQVRQGKFKFSDDLRSAARFGSKRAWKTDTMLPPTVWYLDRADFLGFRIVRPLKLPSAGEAYRFWNNGVPMDSVN